MAHVARRMPEDFGHVPAPAALPNREERGLVPSGGISGSTHAGMSGAISDAVTWRTTAPSIPPDVEPVHMERARRRHWRRPRAAH